MIGGSADASDRSAGGRRSVVRPSTGGLGGEPVRLQGDGVGPDVRERQVAVAAIAPADARPRVADDEVAASGERGVAAVAEGDDRVAVDESAPLRSGGGTSMASTPRMSDTPASSAVGHHP